MHFRALKCEPVIIRSRRSKIIFRLTELLFPFRCHYIIYLLYLLNGTFFFFPPIRDFDSLNKEDHAANLQLALDISEREFGIRPFSSVKELSDDLELDKTTMITYLSKFYELFRGTPLPASGILLCFTPFHCF